jgi:hypothetical protein
MNEHITYGFAALSPETGYPSFREGLKLDFIPVDFFLPDEQGYQLMQFLEQSNQGWDRATTSSELLIIDGLLARYAQPDIKAVNTYVSRTRTPLVGDGRMLIMATTCHVASEAVIKQLVAAAAEPPMPSDLLTWASKHSALLKNAGGAVVTRLHTFEMRYVIEETASPTKCLQRYL